MPKLYRKDGVLGAEDRSSPIAITKWLREALITEEKGTEHFAWLLEKGVYFRQILTNYPSEFPKPISETIRSKCHTNSLNYAIHLFRELPDERDSIEFVTGMYSLESQDSRVPYERRFFIDHHSFLSYKGRVLDLTLLEHPPKFFSVREYYGVSIPFAQTTTIFESLSKEEEHPTADTSITRFLDVIREKTRD